MGEWGQRLSREEVELLASLVGEPLDEFASVYNGGLDGAHWDVTLVAGGRRVELGWADEVLPDAFLDESIRLTVGTRGRAPVFTWLPSPYLGRLELRDLGTIVALDLVVADASRDEQDGWLTEAERELLLRVPPIDVGVRIATDLGRCVCVCTCVDVAFIEVTTDGSLPRAVDGIARVEPVEQRLQVARSGDGPPPDDVP